MSITADFFRNRPDQMINLRPPSARWQEDRRLELV
jgi:hypothetical protein